MRAKKKKDTYFETGIAQSLENNGNLWKKLTNRKLVKNGKRTAETAPFPLALPRTVIVLVFLFLKSAEAFIEISQ